MRGRGNVKSILANAYFYAIAILLPVMQPSLPLNTTLFDYANGLFIIAFALYFLLAEPRPIETPLLIPMLVIWFASLFSMLGSPVLATNAKALLQELYLFVFVVVIYNVVERQHHVKNLVVAWMIFAGLQGALVMSGRIGGDPERAVGSFLNPNMAGSYLGVSLFLVVYPFPRPHWVLKAVFFLLCAAGLLATNSMGALLGCTMGGATLFAGYWLRASGKTRAKMTLAAVAVSVVGISLALVMFAGQGFFKRLPRSAGGRSAIWRTGIETARNNPLGMGIGPMGFQEMVRVSGGRWAAAENISLHSDYLSYLVERGVVGFVGLVCLLATIGAKAWYCVRTAGTERCLLWMLGLLGMLVYVLSDAIAHEVLHYRHVWLAFALIAAQWKVMLRATCEDVDAVAAGQPPRAAD